MDTPKTVPAPPRDVLYDAARAVWVIPPDLVVTEAQIMSSLAQCMFEIDAYDLANPVPAVYKIINRMDILNTLAGILFTSATSTTRPMMPSPCGDVFS